MIAVSTQHFVRPFPGINIRVSLTHKSERQRGGRDRMKHTVLTDVLELLLEQELVASESEFSRDWLCRNSSYMRGLRFHDQLPSIAAIAVCASKLEHYGDRLSQTGMHEELSERFLELSEACHRQINERATAKWLAASEMGPAV